MPRLRLVLVGAGHAHAIVLERWAASGLVADITVVTDDAASLYSGMVPGWIAGEYDRSDLELDARLMARRAGARLVLGRVERVDSDARILQLTDGTHVPYDIASLDLGSATDRPTGGQEVTHVSAYDPDGIREALSAVGGGSVVVVGGGAAGVELAACARAVVDGSVTLVESEEDVLGTHPASVSRKVRRALERLSVSVRTSTAVTLDSMHDIDDVRDIDDVPVGPRAHPPGDVTIWATGANAPALLAMSGLPVDGAGFVVVGDDLRVVGHDNLFAAGDCASRQTTPDPKAGFHAIEQGKVLADNLAATAQSWPKVPTSLRPYDLRSDFLTLLNLGNGRALGVRWGLAVEGRWVRIVKDLVDRRFVRRFQDG